MSSVVLLDQDNIRASAGWPPAKPFRERIGRYYALHDPTKKIVIIAVDEHKRSSDGDAAPIRARQLGPRVVAAFSGPKYRADDLIARDCEWWSKRPEVSDILVVSSDKLVRKRCGEVKNRHRELRLRFDTGEAFALMLPPEHGGGASSGAVPEVTAVPSPSANRVELAVDEFMAWIESEKPGPSKSATEVALAGEIARQGTKRKLGKRR